MNKLPDIPKRIYENLPANIYMNLCPIFDCTGYAINICDKISGIEIDVFVKNLDDYRTVEMTLNTIELLRKEN